MQITNSVIVDLAPLLPAALENEAAPSSSAFFHWWITVGCTPYSAPSSDGNRYWLWRAVDNEGEVLDFLVQRRRNAKVAKG